LSGLGYKNATDDLSMSSAPAAKADKGSANFVNSLMKENAIAAEKDGLVTMNEGGDICLVTVQQVKNDIASG
jgi:hypothetical protein